MLPALPHRNSGAIIKKTAPASCESRWGKLRLLPAFKKILESVERGFSEIRVLVIGDLMLDRYILGDVDRISPEAPVPVLRHVQRYETPGGAANVAMNLAGLGCQTLLAGFIAT